MMKNKMAMYYKTMLACTIIFVACTTTGSDTATTITTEDHAGHNNEASAFVLNPELDPQKVLGSMVEMLADTLGVKMSIFTAKPGESWNWHQHPDFSLYVLEGGTFTLFTDASGKVDTVTMPSGVALVTGPEADSGTNIGNTTLRFLVQDIYRPRSK